MKTLKSISRILFRLFAGFILIIVVYGLLAWSLPYVPASLSQEDPADGIVIYVQSNGVHTDLVFPLKSEQMDWENFFDHKDFKNVYNGFNYVAIGWGDKGFFLNTPTWADLKFSTAFKAAFGMSTTAMHVTYKFNEPTTGENCKKLVISKKQYETMLLYVLSSFQLKDKKPIHIDHDGYGQQDTFYEANGTYTLFKTCNVWTGNALRISDVPIGVWTPFAGGVMRHLKE